MPSPAPQRAPAPVVEADSDHMSAVEELVEALARPFTVSNMTTVCCRRSLYIIIAVLRDLKLLNAVASWIEKYG